MIESLKTRMAIVIFTFVVGILYLLPNFVQLPEGWWFTKEKLVYGLDIQGGVHLVMGVDVPGVLKERHQRLANSIRHELEEKSIPFKAVGFEGEDFHAINVELENPADLPKLETYIKDQYATTLQVVSQAGNRMVLKLFEPVLQEYKKHVLEQSIEVIRNRIDEFGVAEPSIAAQGEDRIIVQLPGIKDSERAKELINRTARLDFRIVADSVTMAEVAKWVEEAETAGSYKLGQDGLAYSAYVKKINEDLKDKLPENTAIVFEKAENAVSMEVGKMPYLVRTDTDLSGDQLEDAFVSFGEFGEPEVIFKFSPEGRVKFAEITAANVKKPMAIVLDEIVQSAPVIQDRIDSPTARITLNQRNFEESQKEAKFIATALRAGALPAALQQLEERTVGPTLGADSVNKAEKAGYVALLLVAIFMLLYYRALGVVANLALGLNLIFILAVLSSLGATLTLPGVAGIVLTVGMAVDANVLIFERIKEELAKGAGLKSAVRDGFSNALSAILDSNITTIITCIVLIYFGTGPVRGFGVSLMIGIITSMFTAIFVARTVVDLLVNKFKLQKLV